MTAASTQSHVIDFSCPLANEFAALGTRFGAGQTSFSPLFAAASLLIQIKSNWDNENNKNGSLSSAENEWLLY